MRRLLGGLVLALGLVATASAQEDLRPGLDHDTCLLPEEIAVVERVRSRDRELDQREEWIVLQEQALDEQRRRLRDEAREIEARRREMEALLRRRDEARDEGLASFVRMVDPMKARAGAELLSRLDPHLAGAVLEELTPRQAAKILGAMDPDVAATVGGTLLLQAAAELEEEGSAR